MSIGAVPSPAPVAAPTMAQAPTPAPAPPPQPKGIELEQLARGRLCRLIGLQVTVNAPTWNQILFATQRTHLRIQPPPVAVLHAIDANMPPPPAPGTPPDSVRDESESLLKSLADSRPRGDSPRSIAGGRKLPPAADAVARWLRNVWIVIVGPEAMRLLVAAGYLTPRDVSIAENIYPKGLDEERKNAVGGAIALQNAAMRGGHETDLPNWLNDQLLTLMDEQRPSDYFAKLYADDAKQNPETTQNPPSTTPNLISQQTAPNSFDQ